MTTTTRKTMDTDEVVGERAADPSETQLLTRRRRQRKPKSPLKAALCLLGIHKGSWVYVAEGNCLQGRECGRCGSAHVRTKHQGEWRYIRERACQQVHRCGRCNDVDGKTVKHEWGEAYDIKARWWQGSKEGHRCLRCGNVEEWTVNDD